MQPKMTTSTVVRMSALSGISCLEWTLAKKRLAGSPPSLRIHQYSPRYILQKQKLDSPRKSIGHTTTRGHDTDRGEEQADQREPETKCQHVVVLQKL